MIEEDGDTTGRTRLRVYWISSAFATFIFLMFVFVMMMVPGVPAVQKLWMVSIAAMLFAVPMCIGIWRFDTGEAPVSAWPFGAVVFVILMLGMAFCLINVVALVLIVLRHGFDYAP